MEILLIFSVMINIIALVIMIKQRKLLEEFSSEDNLSLSSPHALSRN